MYPTSVHKEPMERDTRRKERPRGPFVPSPGAFLSQSWLHRIPPSTRQICHRAEGCESLERNGDIQRIRPWWEAYLCDGTSLLKEAPALRPPLALQCHEIQDIICLPCVGFECWGVVKCKKLFSPRGRLEKKNQHLTLWPCWSAQVISMQLSQVLIFI